MSSVIDDRARLALGGRVAAAHHHPELEEEELLEDQAPLRRRAEGVEIDDRRAGGRKVHVEQRLAALDQLAPGRARPAGSGSGTFGGSCASAWCTIARCIFVVSVPVFS